jgi:hypothetical protein
VIQIAPPALPSDWADLCAVFGLKPGSRIQKLACRIDDFQPGQTQLRVAEVDPVSIQGWASVILDTFGFPRELFSEMLTASLTHPSFQPFAAWDGEEIVAGANLFIDGQVGSLNTGATGSGHRGRGAQSGLLAMRAKAAAEAGCQWLVAETGETGTSLNNIRRSGLKILYTRQNWNWEA